MTDRQIHIFLVAADNLNFSAAAKRLYLSQQAVTRQIAALEAEVGVRLFNRTTRSVSLTPAGEIFRREFQAIDQQAQLCMNKIRSLGMGNTAVVSLGIFEHFSREKLIFPLVTQLMQRFPEIYFDVHLLDFAKLRVQLEDGLVDLCITTSSDWRHWPNARIAVCQSKPFEVVYSRAMGLPAEGFQLSRLRDYPQLTLPAGVLLRGQDKWSRQVPYLHLQPCPDLPSLVMRMEAGKGFALLTRVFEGAESPNLIFQPVDLPGAHAEIVCATSAERKSPQLEQVIGQVREFFRTWRGHQEN